MPISYRSVQESWVLDSLPYVMKCPSPKPCPTRFFENWINQVAGCEGPPLATADWMRDRHLTKVRQSAISSETWNLESLTDLCWGCLGEKQEVRGSPMFSKAQKTCLSCTGKMKLMCPEKGRKRGRRKEEGRKRDRGVNHHSQLPPPLTPACTWCLNNNLAETWRQGFYVQGSRKLAYPLEDLWFPWKAHLITNGQAEFDSDLGFLLEQRTSNRGPETTQGVHACSHDTHEPFLSLGRPSR